MESRLDSIANDRFAGLWFFRLLLMIALGPDLARAESAAAGFVLVEFVIELIQTAMVEQ